MRWDWRVKSDCMYKGGECLGVGCQRCVFNESPAAAVIKPKLPVKKAPKPQVKEAPKLSIKSPIEDKLIKCESISPECRSCENIVAAL